MKRTGLQRRWMPSLMSLTLCCSAVGCSTRPTVRPCDWVRPITLERETVDYLFNLKDWPPQLGEDLNEIARHNEKVRRLGVQ